MLKNIFLNEKIVIEINMFKSRDLWDMMNIDQLAKEHLISWWKT